jgi:ketosteroid isomerase-like protein
MRLSNIFLFLLLCICLPVAFSQHKQKSSIPALDGGTTVEADTVELTRLAREAGHAYAARDLTTLERITADDYVQTDVRGGVLKRAEWLEFVKNRQSELMVETDDVHIAYYGQVAVVTGHWKYAKTENGKESVSYSRWTSVWTRSSDGWKRHAFQNTYVNANADHCITTP